MEGDFQLTADQHRFVLEAIQTFEAAHPELTEHLVCLNLDQKTAAHAPVESFLEMLPRLADKSELVDATDGWLLLMVRGELFLTTRKTQQLATSFAPAPASAPN